MFSELACLVKNNSKIQECDAFMRRCSSETDKDIARQISSCFSKKIGSELLTLVRFLVKGVRISKLYF